MLSRYYVTTPIYYVNDRPHIGHVYTTTLADIAARYHRLIGDDTFFLTGTDEHAAKVVDSAAERGKTPQQWADHNAAQFSDTFTRLGMTHDDFIRTTQPRHTERVTEYIKQLQSSGDVYLGEYEGWYDAGQEEYIPENKAKDADYKSTINGKPLVRKKEKNNFFALSKYQGRLRDLIADSDFVQPTARRNEVLARINEGLHDVPISRTGASGWGIAVPGHPDQTIYVWIDALFNYLSTIDTDDRRHYWPADTHLIAKDILWFHAVIWPAILMALSALPGNDWMKTPSLIYAHSFWISEGQKMSKSLGNFIDLEKIDHYVEQFGIDALRYFLATRGPMSTTDSDFAEARFIETYNADLANTLGNCANRITNMTNRYFDGKLPAPDAAPAEGDNLQPIAEQATATARAAYDRLDFEAAAAAGLDLVRAIDAYIERTQPFKLAKQPDRLGEVATILYQSAQAMRIASLTLWPIIPDKVQDLWHRLGCDHYTQALANRGRGDLTAWSAWNTLQPTTPIHQADPLFPRYQPPRP